MNLPYQKKVNLESETIETANEFAGLVKEGDVIAFNGDLGSGKTFFIKALLRNFNIDNASSPTFALINIYENKIKAAHFDFYRINKIEELYDIGFEEYIKSEKYLSLIEWSDMFPDVLPERRYEISIELNDDLTRNILIKKYE